MDHSSMLFCGMRKPMSYISSRISFFFVVPSSILEILAKFFFSFLAQINCMSRKVTSLGRKIIFLADAVYFMNVTCKFPGFGMM